MTTWNRYQIGEALAVLRTLPADTFHTCVTSPPYWGLRDYGHPEQLGHEPSPQEYIARLAAIFDEARRVLRPDGTLWLNLGDSYAGAPGGFQGKNGQRASRTFTARIDMAKGGGSLKPKDLVGIPWMAAFALRDAGWYLRSDIIWAKPNPMVESVVDRPTKAHEYLFLLSKSERYHYDAAAIREAAAPASAARYEYGFGSAKDIKALEAGLRTRVIGEREHSGTRNRRSVWTIATQPYHGAHFAVMPSRLIEPCILAGAPLGGLVLDPFLGSGTVGMVAEELGRQWFGIELNPEYEPLIRERTAQAGLFARGVQP